MQWKESLANWYEKARFGEQDPDETGDIFEDAKNDVDQSENKSNYCWCLKSKQTAK